MTTPPADWLRRLPQLAGTLNVEVAGYDTAVELTPQSLEAVYLPMLAMLDQHARSRRVIAALAGIPGSGKSTFVAVLTHLADQLLGEGVFAAVSIDGWHLPNVILDARTTLDAAGQTIPLRQRKGGPESFDIPAIAAAVRQLADSDQTISLPVYDRRLHDPRPDGLTVTPQARIILVEGNYLFDDSPPWNTVSALLSPKFLLACDPATARQRVIARHIRGGCTPTEAERKYDQNDGLNAAIVLQHAPRADWTIAFDPTPRLSMNNPSQSS